MVDMREWQEEMKRKKGVSTSQPSKMKRNNFSKQGNPSGKPSKSENFYNPYHFVPVKSHEKWIGAKRREDLIGTSETSASHHKYVQNRFSGRILCKL